MGLEKQLQSKSSMTSTTRALKTEVRKFRTLLNLIHTLSFSIHFLRKLWGTKTKPRMRMPQLPLMPETETKSEKTFRKLFPKVELSVCPHNIQNFGNSTADIYILGQFHTYLHFRGKKYLNTFVVTNTNDCPNILSHGAIFRMSVLVPNYPEENLVRQGDWETGTSSVFQILQDLRIKQYQGKSESKSH